MKKNIRFLSLFLMPVLFASAVYAQTVENFEDFNAALSVSSPSYTITLSSDIIVQGALNSVTPDILNIEGSGFYFDGNEQNTNFNADAGKVLSFSDIILKNFSISSSSDALGAISVSSGVLQVSGSTLSYNSVTNDSEDGSSKAYGGAIYNLGTANIYNSSVMYNSANNINKGMAKGGAVFNEGTLNIIADGADVEFTGNKAAGASNAVHNTESAEMNLNANTADSIIFNDAITGDNGIININADGEWDLAADVSSPTGNKIPDTAPKTGTIVFNNAVSGNDINLFGGTLKLGIFDGIKDPEDGENYLVAASRGSVGSRVSSNNLFLYDGSTFDMVNGKSDDIVYVSTFSVVSGTANVKIDVDLANLKSDKIDISQETLGNGKLSFSGMNIISDFKIGVSTDIAVFSASTMTVNYLDGIAFSAYGSSTVYRITQGSDDLSLNFLLTGYTDDPFQHAVSTQTGDRTYNLQKDYNVAADFDPLMSTGTLYINGVGEDGAPVTIYGNKVSNIFNVSDTDTFLNIENLIIADAQAEQGGAIYNAGTVSLTDTQFKENIASSSSSTAQGGAVYNESILNIYDSAFYGNVALGTGAAGGAIYSNGGVVNIMAKNDNVEFRDNKADGKSSAVHLSSGAKLNLNASTGRSTAFYDSILSDGNNNIININATSAEDPSVITSTKTTGAVYLNADMSGFGNLNSASGNTVNLYNGSIIFAQNTVFFKDIKFNMYGGSRLDMVNGKIDNISVQDFNLPDSGSSYLSIDVNLRTGEADNFVGSALQDSTGELIIDKLVIMKDVKDLEQKVSIQIADDGDFINVLKLNSSREEVLGPVFSYYASLNNGNLNFEHTFDFNPAVFIAPITMQTGGYLGQLNSYEQAFSVIDKALSEEGVKGLWFRPYAYNEDINLNKNLTVTNTAYGIYAGYNSAPANMGKNVSGVFSLYGAYNASDQSYSGATINQGGGLLGASAVFFKERFYTAFTANIGVVNEHGEGKYGKDNFMMYTKGVAIKSGYNFSLDEYDKYILQPSLNLSCSIVEIAPYRNTAGVKVDVGRFAPFHIEPGLKLIADLEKDVKSFINISTAWSLSSDTDCTADDIQLPEMSIDPYVQYGLGLEKAFSEKFSAGAEIYGRSLGRMGVGGQLSVRWNF